MHLLYRPSTSDSFVSQTCRVPGAASRLIWIRTDQPVDRGHAAYAALASRTGSRRIDFTMTYFELAPLRFAIRISDCQGASVSRSLLLFQQAVDTCQAHEASFWWARPTV